jgi:hypothetical protein
VNEKPTTPPGTNQWNLLIPSSENFLRAGQIEGVGRVLCHSGRVKAAVRCPAGKNVPRDTGNEGGQKGGGESIAWL